MCAGSRARLVDSASAVGPPCTQRLRHGDPMHAQERLTVVEVRPAVVAVVVVIVAIGGCREWVGRAREGATVRGPSHSNCLIEAPWLANGGHGAS
jgi:hypothetical protein